MDKKVKYKLKHPFEYNGETISEVLVRTRVKVKDSRRMLKARIEAGVEDGSKLAEELDGITFIASMTGLPDDVFDEMDAEDLDGIGAIIAPEKKPETPETKTAEDSESSSSIEQV